MNIRNRLDKLENRTGIKMSVADDLLDLKRRAEAGEHIPSHTPDELRQLISECQNGKLKKLYQASLRAKCR